MTKVTLDLVKPPKQVTLSGKMILIEEQEDGNWKGWCNRFGKLVEVREISPTNVVQALITHSGI